MRYWLLASIYHSFVSKIAEGKRAHELAQRLLHKHREIRQAIVSSVIFTILSVQLYYAYQHGWTKVYVGFDDYPWWWFLLSIVIVLAVYETYYYWLHRWMHLPAIFKVVHKTHHENKNPSVFTSFAFHPWEALLQFLPLPLIVFLMPMHYMALFAVLMIMTLSALINHAGVEIFPNKFYNHPVGKHLIGSTHHDLHHKEFNTNFGLYLTLWDRIMKTESRRFESEFDKNTSR